ncbi:hypothetical protein [Natrialba sp. INN-245]|uniref:hypothetical protein n=1 Tax=Natrialba sp. INN-245 TaxID=2690967 RepID=UPI00190F955B|nr:hypothetical protein [Natrialba sp. INN-245]
MGRIAVILGVLFIIGGVATTPGAAGDSQIPQSDTLEDELEENEDATLWSKEENNCLSDDEYYEEHGENRSALHGLGDCTDITFAEPPRAAQNWTNSDFKSIQPGDSDTSVYPEHAETNSSQWIADAHATIFALQPSTIVHQGPNETLYVAPTGELRGMVDYRVDVPEGDNSGNRTVDWSLLEHDIREIRLIHDGETIANNSSTHTPQIEYDLGDRNSSTLTLEADVEAELERTVTYQHRDETTTETYTDSVTVSSEREIEVYNLSASLYYAAYPDGDDGVAIYQSLPWHGYVLSEDGERTVRGVWRYYTARDTDWDTFVRASTTETELDNETASPVYVRAFPSRIGPRADPIHSGPTIEEVWGDDSPSPNRTIHENVEIDVVDEPYTRSHGLAVRDDEIDRDHLEVQGIVRGETATLVGPEDGSERQVHESNISVEILEQDDTEATFEITLTDTESGNPIALNNPYANDPRFAPISERTRDGYITVDGERVETNSSGVTTVTVSQPGPYTVEYHPGSWRTNNPAYVSDAERVSWHPLLTARGWFDLFIFAVWLTTPFLIALYAGLKLGSFLRLPGDHNP